MKHQFRLMYCVPDSDRSPIRHKDADKDSENDKPWLFDSVDEAVAFREANDLSDVYEDAFYWISERKGYNYSDKNPNLKHCYIELAE